MLNEIQVRLNAPKNQYNNFGKYKYRSVEDILTGLKPLLKEFKASVTLDDKIILVGDRYYVEATATLYNEEMKTVAKNSAYAREELTKKGMDSSQITGTASSYARKYALNGLFAIDDTKDADSMDNSSETKQDTSTSVLTDKQLKYINTLISQKGVDRDMLKTHYSVTSLKELSADTARKLIDWLNAQGVKDD